MSRARRPWRRATAGRQHHQRLIALRVPHALRPYARQHALRSARRRALPQLGLTATIIASALVLTGDPAHAAVAVTAATGGTTISADTAGGAFTALTGPKIAENKSGEIGVGGIILDAPAGFAFRTSQPVAITDTTGGNGNNTIKISATSKCAATDSMAMVTPTASQVTFWVCSASSNGQHLATLTYSALAVRPTAGKPLASGDLTVDNASTSNIVGLTKGATNLGTLTEVAGAMTQLQVSGIPNAVTAGTAASVTVKTVDQFGNQTDTGYSGTIHFTSSDGQATVPGNYTFAVGDHGSHTFASGVTLKTTGSRSVAATDTVTSALHGTQTVTVSPGAASTFVVSGMASPRTAGTAATVTVTARDTLGNTATGYAGTVHFTSSDGRATLPANSTLTAGTNSFSVTLKTAATQTVTATDTVTNTITGSQSGIIVNPGTTSTLLVAASPTTVVAGSSTTVTVTANDAFANTTTTYGGTVHLTSSDGQAVVPADSTLTSGTRQFSVTLTSAGTQTVSATDTVTSSINGSASVTVAAGAATHFSLSDPASTTAGTSQSVTVTALDAFNNTVTAYAGTVHFTSTDGQAELPSNAALTHGTDSFPVTLKTAGSQTVTATDTVTSTITGNKAITVNPAAVSKLSVATVTPVTAGSSFSITVTAQDPFGNTVPGYTGTLHFTSSDAQAALPGDTTLANGSGTFSVTLRTASVNSITATDAVTTSITGTASGITVNPGTATHFVLAPSPTSLTAGTSETVTVTAVDAFENTSPAYGGTVHFSSNDTQAVVPTNATVSNGTGTFSVTLKTAGSRTVVATDTVTSSITGAQAVTVNPAATSQLALTGIPDPSTAGVTATLAVTAEDAFANATPGFGGTVHFSSTDPQASLPVDAAIAAGAGTFNVILATAGSGSITATDAGDASISGTRAVTVNAAVASHLRVTGIGSPITAGALQSMTVTALDPFGNTATTYLGTVHFTSSDPQAVLPANGPLAAGTATFVNAVVLKTAGSQSVTATDTVATTVAGAQSGITVQLATLAKFAVIPALTSVAAGALDNVTVTAEDAFNNIVTTYAGTVTFGSFDTKASLPAPAKLTSGVGVFPVTFGTPGPQFIAASDSVDATLTGAATVSVSAGPAASLVLSPTPATVTAGSAESVTVTALDQYGNLATGYSGTVHFTSTDTHAVVPANAVLAGGSATFSATFETAGSQTLTATDTVTAAIAGVQSLTVSPAAAVRLVVSAVTPVTAGTSLPVTVTAVDAFNNVATAYTGTVHFTSTDGQATLPVDTTLTDGAATFTATLKTAPAQSLTATDTVTSTITGTASGITVNPSTATRLALVTPSSATAGAPTTLTVTATDAFGNTVPGYGGTIHYTASDPQATLPPDGTIPGGTASLPLALKTAGSQTVSATDTILSGQSAPVLVSAAAANRLSVQAPATTTAGTPVNVIVTARDPFNNVATGYAGTLRLSSTDPRASLPPDLAYTPVDSGIHVFIVTPKTAGSQSITATDTVTASIAGGQTVQVSPAGVASLVVAGIPSTVQAGTTVSVTVTTKDAFANTVTGYGGTVHFTSSDSQAVLPADATLTSGTGAFTVTLRTVGTQSITATDSATATITGSESGISVNFGTVTRLSVSPSPALVGAGATDAITVTALDAFGNTATGYGGTVHFASSDSHAVLPADATLTNGVGSFDATMKTAGTQTLTASDTASRAISGSQSLAVLPAAPKMLTVTGIPSAITAGVAATATISAKDTFGNTATSYNGTVHLTSSDGHAILDASTSLSSGTGSFPVTLVTAGPQSISATDVVDPTITGAESGIVVGAAGPAHLHLVAAPSAVAAGAPTGLTVTTTDAYGNLVAGYTGTIHFTTTDPITTGLPPDRVFTAADAGIVHVTVTFGTAGAQSVNAADTTTASLSGTSNVVTVTAGQATHLTVSGPATTTAGAGALVTVSALDALGNIDPNYAGTVHFTSTDPRAGLPPNGTLLNGSGAFNVTLETAAAQTVSGTDIADLTITGVSGPIAVGAGSASRLVLGVVPNPVTAGNGLVAQVTAVDMFGNAAPSYAGTVTLTTSDTQAVLPGPHTFSPGDGGVFTFGSLIFKTAGAQSVNASDGTINGTASGITVNPAAATSLTVTGAPSVARAGDTLALTVTAKDPFGNVATSFADMMHLTSTDPAAALGADAALTFGTAAFDVTLKTATLASTVTATDLVNPTINGTTAAINVSPGPAATLLVTTSATDVPAGTSIPVSVTARDAFGNTATAYAGVVHLTSSDRQAALSADATLTGGASSFTATLKTAGIAQTVTASDTVTPSITGTTSAVAVGPGSATHLALLVAPLTTTAGNADDVAVAALDAFGNTATGYRGTIHLRSSDPQATLAPDTTFQAANAGTLVLPAGTTFKTSGTQTVTGTDTLSSGLTGTSNTVTVTAAGATRLTAGAPVSVTAGAALALALTARDRFGNVATAYTGTIHLTTTDAAALVPADFTFTSGPGLDNGLRTATLALVTAGNQAVTATDTANSLLTASASTTVDPGALSNFTVSAPPSATAGQHLTLTVTAEDYFKNLVTAYTGAVHFTSTDSHAILPTDATLTNGTSAFDAQMKTAGAQTVTVTDTANATITGTSTTVAVSAAALDHLSVDPVPTSTAAGGTVTATVTARDAYGNTVLSYGGTVAITSSDPAAGLPPDSLLTGGMHAFAVVLKTSGSQTIAATDSTTSSITGTSPAIAVGAGPATRLTVAVAPTSLTAGQTASLAVTAVDQYGNVSASYTGLVQLTTTDPHATVPGDVFLTNGLGLFTVTLRTAALQTVTATDTTTSSITGTSPPVAVTAGPPASLQVTGIPNPIPAHLSSNVTVTVSDAFGNTVSGYTGTVHFTSSDALATLPPDSTLPGGTHTFVNGVIFYNGGTQSVTATDMSTPTLTGTDSGIVVTTTGTLTLSDSSQTVNLPPVTLNGTTQLATGDLAAVQVQNGRNIADGWTVSATMSDLTADGSTAANHTIPASDVAIDPGANGGCHPYDANGDGLPDGLQQGVTAGPGGLFSTTASPVTLSNTTPVNLCWGSDGFGQGAYEDQPAIQVRIAPSKAAGTYTGTLTIIAA